MVRRTKECLIAALVILAWTQIARTQTAATEPPPMMLRTPESIVTAFIEAEMRVRDALKQHTFKRDVVLQTIGPNGQVTGQYIRNSQFIFDDRGNRIEQVIYRPPSTLRGMRITKEDIQDLAGAQLLGIDIAELAKYRLTYAGQETLSDKLVYRLMVEPADIPNPHRMRERFFRGSIWIDTVTFQIVRIRGIVEPQGKQRFPKFETWREPTTATFSFPTRTEADDVLHFPNSDVHYRVSVKYYDYRLFASTLRVKEIDPPEQPKACFTNHNAPGQSGYYWRPDTNVKVHFWRGRFTAEQQAALLAAMKVWSDSVAHTDSGVSFSFAGEIDQLATCKGCLTVTRSDVHRRNRKQYALFDPLQHEGGLLIFALIDLDFATTKPKALQGFMVHELGHGLGLWNCKSCKKRTTIMRGFPGINKDNGLIEPSPCDVEVVRQVYQLQRRVDKNTIKRKHNEIPSISNLPVHTLDDNYGDCGAVPVQGWRPSAASRVLHLGAQESHRGLCPRERLRRR
jgi:hypothetical protein